MASNPIEALNQTVKDVIGMEETGKEMKTEDGFVRHGDEGIVNTVAVTPEVHYEEPGDLKEKNDALKIERMKEVAEANDIDEDGKLTMDKDTRGKGPGVV